jgi:hypothetical protein
MMSQHKVGVRAGMNYDKFTGPLEEGEDYGVANGFHFGINYTYLFNDIVSFRGEVLYIQRGTKQTFSDTGSVYYIINAIERADNFVAFGEIDYQLEVSNSYFSIPLTAHFRLNQKFEAFAGVGVEFLIGPSAKGLVDFENEDFFFRQSLDYNYSSNTAGSANTFISDRVAINVDGEALTMPRFVGAYYNFRTDQVTGQRFKRVDAKLILGLNYFINPGFYVGARAEYGLTDMTNNNMDYSLRELDTDRNFIFRDDIDHSIGLSLSFGFRF